MVNIASSVYQFSLPLLILLLVGLTNGQTDREAKAIRCYRRTFRSNRGTLRHRYRGCRIWTIRPKAYNVISLNLEWKSSFPCGSGGPLHVYTGTNDNDLKLGVMDRCGSGKETNLVSDTGIIRIVYEGRPRRSKRYTFKLSWKKAVTTPTPTETPTTTVSTTTEETTTETPTATTETTATDSTTATTETTTETSTATTTTTTTASTTTTEATTTNTSTADDCGLIPGAGSGALASSRIVGGTASNHPWPWHVYIYIYPTCGGSSYICGGSIISDKWVLTAAHCVTGRVSCLSIYAGTNTRGVNPQVRQAKLPVKIHPKYYPYGYLRYDLALIEVSQAFTFSEKVGKVCLPVSVNLDVSKPVTVTGFGATSYEGSLARSLREVEVPLVSNAVCGSARQYRGWIHDEHICAGVTGMDSCQGDSGGPLVQQAGGVRWYQQGIVSSGYGCAFSGYPGIYTRVSEFVDWIRDNCDKCIPDP